MRWPEFEQLVKAAFERDHYRVTIGKHDHPDGGVDLVLRRRHRMLYVQCKRWKDQLVKVDQVRALHGVAASEHADGSVFVTSGIFSQEARNFARQRTVRMQLIDGEQLARFLSELNADNLGLDGLLRDDDPSSRHSDQ